LGKEREIKNEREKRGGSASPFVSSLEKEKKRTKKAWKKKSVFLLRLPTFRGKGVSAAKKKKREGGWKQRGEGVGRKEEADRHV